MTKLYISAMHPGQFVAQVPGTGWVTFPAAVNGWEVRRPARGLDPVHLREVPARLAATAGLPQIEIDTVAPHFAKVA